ncbi:ATP-binding protein [bacterium]|nr:ATP-binding protein [bacterium]
MDTVENRCQATGDEKVSLYRDTDSLLLSSEIGIVFLDTNLVIRALTPAMRGLINLTEESIGESLDHIAREVELPPGELKRFVLDVRDAGVSLEQDVRRSSEGEERWLEMRLRPSRGEAESQSGVVLIFLDVTARRRREEKSFRSSAPLDATSKELQEFANAVSHDLRAPLRHIRFLLEKQVESGGDVGDVEKIFQKIDYMSTLIQSLSEFSRIYSRAGKMEFVPCAEVLDVALRSLRVVMEESGAQLHHTALPSVLLDKPQLTRVFQSLIDNAVKFRGDSAPVIEVSAEHLGEEWRFRVRDNGRGMNVSDQAEHDRAFLLFQRLHNDSSLPGTGVGLAISKRIIERHGGQIWIESNPGEGTDVLFTIPAGGSRFFE